MAEKVELQVTADVAKATAGLKKVTGGLGKLEKQTKASAKTNKNYAAGMAGVGIALVGVAMAMGKAVDAASDLTETTNKFKVIFADVSDSADAMADTLVRSYGMGMEQSKKLLSNTGDLLTGMGMTGKAALKMSADVVTLGADMASFSNLSGGATQASEILTKALLGERDALTSLGVKISENDIKAGLAAEGNSKLTGTMLLQAKAALTLKLITAQSSNAMGDVADNTHTYAFASQRLTNRLKDMTAEVGGALLPILKPLKQMLADLIEWFMGLSKETKTAILIFAGLAVAIGIIIPVVMAFGFSLNAALLPVTAIVLAIGGLVLLAVQLKRNWSVLSKTFQLEVLKMQRSFTFFWNSIKLGGLIIAKTMAQVATDAFLPILKGIDVVIDAYNALKGTQIKSATSALDAANKSIDAQIKSAGVAMVVAKERGDAEIRLAREIAAEKRALAQEDDEITKEAEVTKHEEKTALAAERRETKVALTAAQKQEDLLAAENAEAGFVGLVIRYNREHKKAMTAREKSVLRQNVAGYKMRIGAFNEFSGFMMAGIDQQNAAEFKIYKAFAIVQAGIQAASAAVAAFNAMAGIPVVGPALGAIAAAAATAMGLRNIAKIKAQKPQKAALGGIIPGSGLGTQVTVGEGSRDEAIIPLNNPAAQERLQGLGGGGVTINMNVENLLADVEEFPRQLAEAIDVALYDLDRNNQSTFADGLGGGGT